MHYGRHAGHLVGIDATKQESNMTPKIAFVFAAAASTMSLGAMAQTVITVPVAPPATIVETVPAAPPGYVWAAPHWAERPDGSWGLVGGAFVPRNEAQIMGAGR